MSVMIGSRGFTMPTLLGGTPKTEMERLEAISADEGPALDERLRTELGRVTSAADRVGEGAAVNKASAQADRNSANDSAQFERSTRTLDLSDRQRKSANRRLGLSRTLNRASAAGTTRRGFTDRAKAAMSIGGSFSDALFGQRVAGQGALAESETLKQMSNDRRNAAKKVSTLATIGTVVGTAAMFFSSEKLKHDHGHEGGLLSRLKNVRVNRWQYKGDQKTHVGPFSEEFNREFGIDTDRPDMISVIDALGVTLGAVKELDRKVEARGQ